MEHREKKKFSIHAFLIYGTSRLERQADGRLDPHVWMM